MGVDKGLGLGGRGPHGDGIRERESILLMGGARLGIWMGGRHRDVVMGLMRFDRT